MTRQLSMKIPDELDARLRVAAGDNVSQWVAEAIQDRLLPKRSLYFAPFAAKATTPTSL